MHKTTCGQDLLSAALNQSGLTDFDIEETNGSNHVLSEKSSVEPLIKFLVTVGYCILITAYALPYR